MTPTPLTTVAIVLAVVVVYKMMVVVVVVVVILVIVIKVVKAVVLVILYSCNSNITSDADANTDTFPPYLITLRLLMVVLKSFKGGLNRWVATIFRNAPGLLVGLNSEDEDEWLPTALRM